jgi:hypothetical protein
MENSALVDGTVGFVMTNRCGKLPHLTVGPATAGRHLG